MIAVSMLLESKFLLTLIYEHTCDRPAIITIVLNLYICLNLIKYIFWLEPLLIENVKACLF